MLSILVDKLLSYALARQASGFVLAAGRPPAFIVDDELVDIETQPLSEGDVVQCAESLGLAAPSSDAGTTFTYRKVRVHASMSGNRVVVRFGV